MGPYRAEDKKYGARLYTAWVKLKSAGVTVAYSNQSQQVPQYPQTSFEQISRSELIKEAVPVLRNDSQYRAGRAFRAEFRGHGGFERRITNVPGVNHNSIVVASISEVGIIGGEAVSGGG
ncbi:hypothetical protein [Peribacillus frigoritolerans]|uniref:hypothetical protein n=1 Tax=Peribacillus frigoritolerans TaxID=450367 RepID=UPI0024C1DEB5|nr:hypothetical protein [Peribacillus frigoritolerans]WHX62352.1 hypothetical protein QNH33_01700 [Peribacillus frigoritolerans]